MAPAVWSRKIEQLGFKEMFIKLSEGKRRQPNAELVGFANDLDRFYENGLGSNRVKIKRCG